MIVTVYLAGYRIEPSCFDIVRAGILRYRHDDEFFDFTVSDRFFVPEEEAVFTGVGITSKEQSAAGTIGGQAVGLRAAEAAPSRFVDERLAQAADHLFSPHEDIQDRRRS